MVLEPCAEIVVKGARHQAFGSQDPQLTWAMGPRGIRTATHAFPVDATLRTPEKQRL